MTDGERVERTELEQRLDALAIPETGLFGPRSFAWRVFRERVLVTYAPRAVMLQYAYPPFASASASYGENDGARFGRAVSTLLAMIFGDRTRVVREARRLFLLHDRLRGTTERGDRFHANERAHLSWVLVTLLDAGIRGYERHVDRIDERALFAELPRMGALFGLGARDLPATRAALDGRIEDAIAHQLVIGAEARAMWAFLTTAEHGPTRPPDRPPRSITRWLARGWAAATLPPALRRALAPKLSDRRAYAIESAGSLLRASLLPPAMRYVEAYQRASKAGAGGTGRPS